MKLTCCSRLAISPSSPASLPTIKLSHLQDKLLASPSKTLSPPAIQIAFAKSKLYGFSRLMHKSRSRSKILHYKLSPLLVRPEYLLRSSLLQ
jgi:hypothetical protein